MKPVFRAKDLVESFGDNFFEQMDYHLVNGWVYSGDDCFVMAEVCSKKELLRQNLNNDVDNDTWFVYAYAGKLERVLELIPFEKEFIGFRRNNGKIRLYRYEELMKKIRTGANYGRR